MSTRSRAARSLASISHRKREITCELCGRRAMVRSAKARICGKKACRLERDRRSRAKHALSEAEGAKEKRG